MKLSKRILSCFLSVAVAASALGAHVHAENEPITEDNVSETTANEEAVDNQTSPVEQDSENELNDVIVVEEKNAAGYNVAAAINYAKLYHTKATNDTGLYYGNNGGDCAYFVSRCLSNGGINVNFTTVQQFLDPVLTGFTRYSLYSTKNGIPTGGQNAGKISQGDVLVYSCACGNPHVALVGDCSGSTVKVYSHTPAMGPDCQYESAQYYVCKNGHGIYNGNGGAEVLHYTGSVMPAVPPTDVSLSINKYGFNINDIITLTPHASNASYFYMTVVKDDVSIISTSLSGSYSFNASDYGFGNYYAWITATNSSGGTDSKPVLFGVFPNPVNFGEKVNVAIKRTDSEYIAASYGDGLVSSHSVEESFWDTSVWQLERLSDFSYIIKYSDINAGNVNDVGKVMTASGSDNGSRVKLQSYTGADNQQWFIYYVPECDKYYIKVKSAHAFLDHASSDGKWQVWQRWNDAENSGYKNQTFDIIPDVCEDLGYVSLGEFSAYIERSDAKYAAKANSGEINDVSVSNGYNNATKWKFVYDAGAYNIICDDKGSSSYGLYMTASGTKDGSKIVLSSYTGKDNQRWQLYEKDNGYYIRPRSTLAVLDHASGQGFWQVWRVWNNESNEGIDHQKFYLITILTVSLDDCTISSVPNQTYTGSSLTPTVTVKDGTKTLTSGTDYTVAYSNNTNAGTATVTITGKGNYTGTKTATFKIVARSIANCTVSAIAEQTYTGSALTPAVAVKDGTKTLTKGTDYTVSYSNNINAGTATVTITGKGNYTGTKTATFKIVKPAPTKPEVTATAGDEQVTLTWNDMGATKYAAYLVNADGTLKALSTKLTGTTYTAKKLTSGTEYTFLVRAYVNGKWTKYDATDYVKATPFSTVVKPTVEVIPADKQVTLTWDAIDGATKYAVYRLQDDGTLKALATKLTVTEYTIKKLVNHTEYQFLVRAYVNGKWTKYDANDYVNATPAALKPLVRVSEYDGMVTLRWGAVDDATKYAAYIVNDDDSLTCVSSKITNIKYTIKNLTNDKEYRFLVRAYVDGKWTKYTERDIISATPHA